MTDGPALWAEGDGRWRIGGGGDDADRVVELLAAPAAADLVVELDDDRVLDVDEIRRVTSSAAEVWRELSTGVLGELEVRTAAEAAAHLRLGALVAATALASAGDARDDEAVALADRFSSFLQRTGRALIATVLPTADGRFRVRWTEDDRQMVATLAAEVESLLASDESDVARLFPPAYGDDAERNEGYAVLARGELIESRRASLAILVDATERDHLERDELHVLMRAVNDLRLVLGTRLDVTEDEPPLRRRDRARAAEWRAYDRLTHIMSDLIACLDPDM